MFRFQRQTQALLGVVGTVHGGVEPPGAVIPPKMVVGIAGVRAQRKHASFGERRIGGGFCLGHFGRFLKRTKGDFAFRSIRSTSALVRKRLALPHQATVGSPPRLAALPLTAGRS